MFSVELSQTIENMRVLIGSSIRDEDITDDDDDVLLDGVRHPTHISDQ